MMRHEEIVGAILTASDDKTNREPVRRALNDVDKEADKVAGWVESGWNPPGHTRSTLREGSHRKEREIERPEWEREQIIHHMLMRQFRRILAPRIYRYACGAVSRADELRMRLEKDITYKGNPKGRGPLFVMRTMKRWTHGYKGKKFYVAELDIKKFYDNVDLALLKSMLRKFIRDKRYLELLFRVIDGSGPGLPKGYFTSPWLAAFYLMPLDTFITQRLKPDHYIRYMDNLFLFSGNKKELHKMVRDVEIFLGERLHLELNGSRQVFRFEYQPKFQKREKKSRRWAGPRRKRRKREARGRAINCLGYVVHMDRITVRKSILKRARAKANRMHRTHRCRGIDAAAMLSYKGWFQHTNTYRYFQEWIKPKVSMRYCRKRIAALARKENKERMLRHDKMVRGT